MTGHNTLTVQPVCLLTKKDRENQSGSGFAIGLREHTMSNFRIPMMRLMERKSQAGRIYFTGYLGDMKIVMFKDEKWVIRHSGLMTERRASSPPRRLGLIAAQATDR